MNDRRNELLHRKQMNAIWAAAGARGFDYDDVHVVVKELTGKRSLKLLTRGEAHRVLDQLNGKDPDAEDRKRARFTGPVRRGERKRERNGDRQDAKDGKDGKNGGNGKIIRMASREQKELIDHLASQAGFTLGAAGAWHFDRVHLEDWLRKKFDLPVTSRRTGKPYRYTGPEGVISERGAQKTIAALRDFVANRKRHWARSYDEEFALVVVEIGVPYAEDRNLKNGVPVPGVKAAVRAEIEARAERTAKT